MSCSWQVQQGGAVLRTLLQHGYKVVAMTRNLESEQAKELTLLGAKVIWEMSSRLKQRYKV